MLDQDEPTSQVDKGLVVFLETLTAWITAGLIIVLVFIPLWKIIINGL